jgi:hypothetical protein
LYNVEICNNNNDPWSEIYLDKKGKEVCYCPTPKYYFYNTEKGLSEISEKGYFKSLVENGLDK